MPGWAAGLTSGVPDCIVELATVGDKVIVVNTVTVGVVALGVARVIGPGSTTGPRVAVVAPGVDLAVAAGVRPKNPPVRRR